MFENLVDFVFPKRCVGCEQMETFLCKECKGRLDFVEQICPECGESSVMGWTHGRCKKKTGMDGLVSVYEYQEPVMRSVIDGIKYEFNKKLVEMVLENFVFELGSDFDYLIPIPLYFYRKNWRGFNQAELIANEVSRRINTPVEEILERTRNTKQQVLMKSVQERVDNVEGAFCVKKNWVEKIEGKRIILVDDVFTSGADMKECARALKKLGVEMVWGFSLAH